MTILRARSKSDPTAMPPDARETDRRPPWGRILLLLALVAILWAPYYAKMSYMAVYDPDAEDYAQIARNLAAGRGMTTHFIPLQQLEWMRQTDRLDNIDGAWYNLHRFPLPSLAEAALFRVFGPTDFAVSLYSALFYLATLPLVFLFAWRLAPHRRNLVATVATLAFALSEAQLMYSITAKTEAATTFFFIAALYLILWPRGWWSLALAGALTGFGFLNRSSAVLYALPFMFLIWHRSSRMPFRVAPSPMRAVALYVAVAFVVVAPWLVRNVALVGDPMFSVTNATMIQYRAEPGNMANPYFLWEYTKPARFLLEHPGWIVSKWVREFASPPDGGFTVQQIGVLTPFLVFGLIMVRGRAGRALRALLIAAFLLHMVVLPLTRNSPRYYNMFAPFVYIFAAVALVNAKAFWRFVGPVRFAVVALLVASVALPWVVAVKGEKSPRPVTWWVESRPENHQWIAANTPEDALIVSDVPMAVAWYGQRRSTSIPPVPEQMSRFAGYRLQPNGIYLNLPQPGVGDAPREWGPWERIHRGKLPVPGFRLAKSFENGALYYERLTPASE